MAGNFNISYTFKAQDKNFTSSVKKINNGLNKTEKSLASVSRNSKIANSTMSGLGSTLRRVGGYFITFFGARAIVNTIADFGASMSKVKAITGATGQEMFKLREQAKELGKTTKFTASQAAEGMVFLGMAGFSTTKILESMPQVLDLAAVANIDLAEASDITSNIMAGFGLEAKDLTNVVDIMATASTNANTNVSQLGQAMKFAAPVSKAFGISVKETTAIMSVFANNGIQATMSGTALRRMLLRITNPTKKAQKYLKAYGITAKDLDIKTLGFTKVMKNLEPVLNDNRASYELFGIQGVTTANIIKDNIVELENFNDSLEIVDGNAKKMARTMEDNLKGDILKFKSAIQGLTLDTGEKGLTGALRSSTQAATEFFRQLGREREIGDVTASMEGLLTIVEAMGWALKTAAEGWKILLGFFAEANALSEAQQKLKERKKLTKLKREAEERLEGTRERTAIRRERLEKEKLGFEGNINITGAPAGSTAEFSTINSSGNLGVNMAFAGGGI